MPLKLGLIGDNIAASNAPRLHTLAGELSGVPTTYDRLVPRELNQTFDEVFEWCERTGFSGLNITYPYKELAAARVSIPEPLVAAVSAVNTVVFTGAGAIGYNTDYSGFMSAYRAVRQQAAPGSIALIGAGGVGKAVAFGLLGLGATEIRITDRDAGKARRLAQALLDVGPAIGVRVVENAALAADGAAGVINCTPVGMVGYEGSPLAAGCFHGAQWAFDAVYTPIDTEFLAAATEAGLQIISGYELFFHQGVHAFEVFSGHKLDSNLLRERLTPSPA